MTTIKSTMLCGFSTVILCFVTSYAQAQVEGMASDPCKGVSCSNHGNCVVVDGNPVCACEEGYAPDEVSGLSCQPVSAQQPGYEGRLTVDPGWALAGAIVGFVGMAVAGGLGGAAAAIYDAGLATGLLGFSSIVTVAATGPIAFAGGKSARRTGVPGVLALRVLSWVTYGSCLANGITILALGAAGFSVPAWPMITTAVLGVTSLMLFAIEALKCHKQAKSGNTTARSDSDEKHVTLAPGVAPVLGSEGVAGGVVGLVGQF